MNTVKVKRDELLAKLEVNRSNHRQLFLDAQEGYRQMVIQELDKSLNDAREGRAIRTHIAMQAPQDHTDDYDNVVAMLGMSVDEVIELDAHDFQCYVMDKWTWAAAANLLNSTYAGTVRR
jgi:hypothetical protein